MAGRATCHAELAAFFVGEEPGKWIDPPGSKDIHLLCLHLQQRAGWGTRSLDGHGRCWRKGHGEQSNTININQVHPRLFKWSCPVQTCQVKWAQEHDAEMQDWLILDTLISVFTCFSSRPLETHAPNVLEEMVRNANRQAALPNWQSVKTIVTIPAHLRAKNIGEPLRYMKDFEKLTQCYLWFLLTHLASLLRPLHVSIFEDRGCCGGWFDGWTQVPAWSCTNWSLRASARFLGKSLYFKSARLPQTCQSIDDHSCVFIHDIQYSANLRPSNGSDASSLVVVNPLALVRLTAV